MAKRKVEYGFIGENSDPASAVLKRQPIGVAELVFRFPGGVFRADPRELTVEMRRALVFHGLKQVLVDAGAGRTPEEFEGLARKRWETLISGSWGADREGGRGPRLTEKAAAISVYARLKGVSTDTATAIYEGRTPDPLGVTWDAARRKVFLGKFAKEIAAERGIEEQEF